jgi:hypothetical protein
MMFMVMKSPAGSLFHITDLSHNSLIITPQSISFFFFFFFFIIITLILIHLRVVSFISKFLVICLFVYANPSRYLSI